VDLTPFYFAFGSDMDLARLRALAGEIEVLGPARLAGYRLGFFDHNVVWDSGIETLLADAAAETWGVLCRLRPTEWERLDACRGANLDGTGTHFHYPVEVTTMTGEELLVRTYQRAVRGVPSLPSAEFLDYLVAAARVRGLPACYQDHLRSLPSAPASYLVPRHDPAQRRHLHVI
jgi:hypothetical protein